MKKVFLLFSILIFGCYGMQSIAQDTEKVLVPNISKSYEGKCKKGLAHGNGEAKGIDTYSGQFKKGLPQGNGTYVWQNGDYYIGQWHKGQRSGEGEFHTKIIDRDTVYAGLWKRDKYIGQKTILPTITYKSSVDRYRFKRIGDGNLISIQFKQNGTTNTSITSLTVDGDSGTEVQKGNCFCFENFVLPFKCSIRYNTPSKLKQISYEARFEFEITQMGNWELILHN
ncbi:hypothetical protein ACXR6G_06470 [Ancylomarina sp. YFZ004]